ncbi:hypothetical protein [Bradyrhizobium sp. RT11b]|uniref:hypothetical protein n=1 Tax=Bradyrhizobium sp. RT11b TaxID=3156332 RepID=UPI00339563B5
MKQLNEHAVRKLTEARRILPFINAICISHLNQESCRIQLRTINRNRAITAQIGFSHSSDRALWWLAEKIASCQVESQEPDAESLFFAAI